MVTQLQPFPDRRRRLIILGVLLVPILLSYKIGFLWRGMACIVPLVFTGTFRESQIVKERFRTQFFFAWIPFRKQSCDLRAVVSLRAKHEEDKYGCLTLVLFGPFQWVFGKVFDQIIPAIGGPLELWVETAKGRELMAWNGHSQELFDQNLAILEARTGAPIRTV